MVPNTNTDEKRTTEQAQNVLKAASWSWSEDVKQYLKSNQTDMHAQMHNHTMPHCKVAIK